VIKQFRQEILDIAPVLVGMALAASFLAACGLI
jgi:hypothetical protein